MIAAAIPRCEASVIDDGREHAGETAARNQPAIMPIGRASPCLFRAANRLRHGAGEGRSREVIARDVVADRRRLPGAPIDPGEDRISAPPSRS